MAGETEGLSHETTNAAPACSDGEDPPEGPQPLDLVVWHPRMGGVNGDLVRRSHFFAVMARKIVHHTFGRFLHRIPNLRLLFWRDHVAGTIPSVDSSSWGSAGRQTLAVPRNWATRSDVVEREKAITMPFHEAARIPYLSRRIDQIVGIPA